MPRTTNMMLTPAHAVQRGLRLVSVAVTCLVLSCVSSDQGIEVQAQTSSIHAENNALKAQLADALNTIVELRAQLKVNAQVGVGNANSENNAGGNIGLTGADLKWVIGAILMTSYIPSKLTWIATHWCGGIVARKGKRGAHGCR